MSVSNLCLTLFSIATPCTAGSSYTEFPDGLCSSGPLLDTAAAHLSSPPLTGGGRSKLVSTPDAQWALLTMALQAIFKTEGSVKNCSVCSSELWAAKDYLPFPEFHASGEKWADKLKTFLQKPLGDDLAAGPARWIPELQGVHDHP